MTASADSALRPVGERTELGEAMSSSLVTEEEAEEERSPALPASATEKEVGAVPIGVAEGRGFNAVCKLGSAPYCSSTSTSLCRPLREAMWMGASPAEFF